MKSIQIVQGFQKCNKKQQMMCRVAKNLATPTVPRYTVVGINTGGVTNFFLLSYRQ
jgi:hypothetical protein